MALAALRSAPGPVRPGSHRYGVWRTSCYISKQFAKPLRQRISQNLFDRPVRYVTVGLLASARRLAEEHPVGRPVTRSAESLRIHKPFHKLNRIPLLPLPFF